MGSRESKPFAEALAHAFLPGQATHCTPSPDSCQEAVALIAVHCYRYKRSMSTADIDSKMAEQDSGNVRALPFGGLFLFTLLSVADLSLTWFLLTEGGGRFIESNPIAAAWLSSYGWAGLVVYKILGLLLVATVALAIVWLR